MHCLCIVLFDVVLSCIFCNVVGVDIDVFDVKRSSIVSTAQLLEAVLVCLFCAC